MKRGNAVIALTVLLAAAATGLLYLYLRSVDARGGDPVATVDVVVSRQEIPANTELTPLIQAGGFATRAIPREDLMAGAITDVAQLRGQRTAFPILEGEQIVAARLKGELELAGGALGISPGHLAVTVKLSDQQGGAGTVTTGDSVTVYASFHDAQMIKGNIRSLLQPGTPVTDQAQNVGDFTITLVPTARVLRVQNPPTSESGEAQTGDVMLTLDLKRRDAQNVVFAQENGLVWVGLLPPGEVGKPVPASLIPWRSLLGWRSA